MGAAEAAESVARAEPASWLGSVYPFSASQSVKALNAGSTAVVIHVACAHPEPHALLPDFVLKAIASLHAPTVTVGQMGAVGFVVNAMTWKYALQVFVSHRATQAQTLGAVSVKTPKGVAAAQPPNLNTN